MNILNLGNILSVILVSLETDYAYKNENKSWILYHNSINTLQKFIHVLKIHFFILKNMSLKTFSWHNEEAKGPTYTYQDLFVTENILVWSSTGIQGKCMLSQSPVVTLENEMQKSSTYVQCCHDSYLNLFIHACSKGKVSNFWTNMAKHENTTNLDMSLDLWRCHVNLLLQSFQSVSLDLHQC